MSDLLLSSVEYGSYISIVKLIVFLVLFYPWLPLVNWVHRDSDTVETNTFLWTSVVLGVGVFGLMIWLLVPLFIVGALLYAILVLAVALVYIKHRNTRVLEFDRVLTAEHIKGLFSSKGAEKLTELKSFLFITANNNEITVPEARTSEFYGYKIAYDIFNDATWRRASDISFYPTHGSYDVAYHVDGVAMKQSSISRDQMEYFIPFVKHLSDLNVKEKRKPQKGHFKIRKSTGDIEWEVITAGSTAGEQIRIRDVTTQEIKRLDDIGLLPDQYEQLDELTTLRQGLFIVSGPRRSGVTTTFYSLLRNHDAFLNSIDTLERRPSADIPNVNQRVFSSEDASTMSFVKKLQSIIRMGPDIVGVAGCDDSETARAICEAAVDNKIIYVTLEASSVIQALEKWLKLVGDRNLAVEPLLGISNQRLIRKLCLECRQAYAPKKELLRKFNIPAEKAKVLYKPGKVQYDKHGKPEACENCQGTGFVGRTSVFELIRINDGLKQAVNKAGKIADINAEFRRAKMLYLQEQAFRKVIAGTTAVNEMIRIFSTSKDKRADKPASS